MSARLSYMKNTWDLFAMFFLISRIAVCFQNISLRIFFSFFIYRVRSQSYSLCKKMSLTHCFCCWFLLFFIFLFINKYLIIDISSSVSIVFCLAYLNSCFIQKCDFYEIWGVRVLRPPALCLVPDPDPQFVFAGPDPQFVFISPDPQFIFIGPGPKFVFTDNDPQFVFAGAGPKFVFTSPDSQFVFVGPAFRFVSTCPGPHLVFTGPDTNFVFTGPGSHLVFTQNLYLPVQPGPKFAYTDLLLPLAHNLYVHRLLCWLT